MASRSALSPCTREWKQRCLRSCQASQPPHIIDYTIHQELLDRPDWQEVCSNLVPEIVEGVCVFSWKNHVLGKEAVPECVEPDGNFPFSRFWSRGVKSVRLVSGFLSFARHSSRVLDMRHIGR